MKALEGILIIFFLIGNCNAISVSSVTELQDVIDNSSYIFLEEGTYVLDALEVRSNTIIMGSGYNTVIIKENESTGAGIYANGNNIKLSNFRYEGNAFNCPGSDHGIRINGCNVKIVGIWVNNTLHHGITTVAGCNDVSIMHCTISNTGMTNTQDGAGIIINGGNSKIIGNMINNTAYHGAQAYTNSYQCIISDNIINDCGNNLRPGSSKGAGIKCSLNTDKIIVKGNIINDNYGEGILLDTCDNITISENIINNASRNVYIRYSDNILCNSNIVEYGRSDGIYSYYSNDVITTGNIIKGCSVKTYNTNRNLISLNSIGVLINSGNDRILNNYKAGVFTP